MLPLRKAYNNFTTEPLRAVIKQINSITLGKVRFLVGFFLLEARITWAQKITFATLFCSNLKQNKMIIRIILRLKIIHRHGL